MSYFYEGGIYGQPTDLQMLISTERIEALQMAAKELGHVTVQDLGLGDDRSFSEHRARIEADDAAFLTPLIAMADRLQKQRQ